MRMLDGWTAGALLLAACDSGGSGPSPDASTLDTLNEPPDAGTMDTKGTMPEASPIRGPDGSLDEGTTQNAPQDCAASAVSTSVTGSVVGVAVGSTEAIGAYGVDSQTGVPYAGVWIWNRTRTCALVQSGMPMPPSTTVLTIELARTNGSTPIAPGTYAYGAANGAPANGIAIFAHFAATDSTCGQVLEDAVGGVVTLDTVCGTTVAGSFALHLSMGGDAGIDELTGTFNAPVCVFDMNNFDPNAPPAGCSSGDP
jgi:hypothetical protein